MSAISELLQSSPESFVRKMLPKGDYLCQIMEAELLHGYWKPNPTKGTKARWFESYVPTIEIVDYVETSDEDIDTETRDLLEKFGDWKGYRPPTGKGGWTQFQQIPGYEGKIKCAGIANGLNFALAETTEDWASMVELSSSAPRFYNSSNSRGEVDGFVVNVLSTEPDNHTPPAIGADTSLPEIIEKTKGCFLVVTLDHEQDEKGEYEPKVVVAGTASI